ncbi:MAG: hypothetical protein ACJ749_13205 [Flavisolibacter sp.]
MNLLFRRLIPTSIVLILFCPSRSFSQDLTGIWKGYFKTETGNHYRLEFQIEQNKSKAVSGVSYSYGSNIEFYGKATMTGRFLSESNSFQIQEVKTVEVKSPGGGTCIMNYRFTYSRSGKEEFLEGTWVGKSEDRNNPKNNGVWGDCGGGTVFLRRVESSDFYVEPFLRDKPLVKDTPVPDTPKTTETKPRKIETEPVPKKVTKPTVTTKKPTVKTPVKTPAKTPPVAKKPVITTRPKTDTVAKKQTEEVITKPVEKPKINIPTTIRSRQNELTQTVTVTNEEITIRLYDNGEVDGDTISVYLDGKPLVTNKGLSTVPVTLKLKMDENRPEHTLVMVAENMGRIPPNTSLMIVQDGDRRYQVSITSTEQKNAMVRFRYEKN